jgi:integrase
MPYLEKRRNLYYATLTIPNDLREYFDNKGKQVKSTGTSGKSKAQRIAYNLVSGWKEEFEQLRESPRDSVHELALALREEIEAANASNGEYTESSHIPSEREILIDAIADMVSKRAEKGDEHSAKIIHSVAIQGNTPIDTYFDDWAGQLSVIQKTKNQKIEDVKELCSHFSVTQEVSLQTVREWLHLLEKQGKTANSRARILLNARDYWGYMQNIGKVPDEADYFKTPANLTKKKRVQGRKSYVPFVPSELVHILQEAISEGDRDLANLILIGMYTGARISEICHLRVEHCANKIFDIVTVK